MSDLDELIGSGLERLAVARTPEATIDPLGPITSRVRRRHRARLGAVLAVPLVLLGLAVWAAWPAEEDDTPVITDPTPTTTTAPPDEEASTEVPGVTILDPGPLERRIAPEVISTDRGILVWGGRRDDGLGFNDNMPFVDGAIYHPGERTWTTIPEAPLTPTENGVPYAAWTGTELVAMLGTEAATWSPEVGWRSLGEVPPSIGPAVWTGDEVLTIDFALDPTTDEWRPLPPRPASLERTDVVWTGQDLVVVGRRVGQGYAPVTAIAYSPVDDAWRILSEGPVDNTAVGATWTGDRVLVANYDMGAALLDPTSGTWEELSAVPSPFTENGTRAVHSGEHSLVLNGGAPSVLGPDRRWTPIPAVDETGHPGIGADGSGNVYLFGSEYDPEGDHERNIFHELDLQELAQGRVVRTPIVRLDLIPSASPLNASPNFQGATGRVGGDHVVSDFEFGVGGEACQTTFRQGVSATSRAGGTVVVTPADGGEPWTGHISGDGTSISRGHLEISCDSAPTTHELARLLRYPPGWVE